MSLTEEQLAAWTKLPDYQVTLKGLVAEAPAGLGISLQDVAEAILDGVAPDNSTEITFIPIVRATIDRISRARLTAVLSRLSDVLEKVEAALPAIPKRVSAPATPLVAGKPAPALPPAPAPKK